MIALLEDWCSVPSNHTDSTQLSVTLAPENMNSSFVLHRHLHIHGIPHYSGTNKYTKINEFFVYLFLKLENIKEK